MKTNAFPTPSSTRIISSFNKGIKPKATILTIWPRLKLQPVWPQTRIWLRLGSGSVTSPGITTAVSTQRSTGPRPEAYETMSGLQPRRAQSQCTGSSSCCPV